MLTLVAIVAIFLILACLILIITSLIGLFPALLVVVAFIALDVGMFKLLFGKKKKDK